MNKNPDHVRTEIPTECEECDDLETCKTGPEGCPKGKFPQWVMVWMESGRGHTTRDETYKKVDTSYDDEDLEALAHDWTQMENDGWQYQRFHYGFERVDQPPDEWLKKRMRRCTNAIWGYAQEFDELARLLKDPKVDYEAFQDAKTYPLPRPAMNIQMPFHPEGSLLGGHKPLTPVNIRPCADEYGGKTYVGFYLGDFAVSLMPYMEGEDKLVVMGHNNPAIYVPALDRIIWGCESWWGEMKEEEMRTITDDDIAGVPYVRILKAMGGQDVENIDPIEVTAVYKNTETTKFTLNNSRIAWFVTGEGDERVWYMPTTKEEVDEAVEALKSGGAVVLPGGVNDIPCVLCGNTPTKAYSNHAKRETVCLCDECLENAPDEQKSRSVPMHETCQCGHIHGDHEGNGRCLAEEAKGVPCDCEEYVPVQEKENVHDICKYCTWDGEKGEANCVKGPVSIPIENLPSDKCVKGLSFKERSRPTKLCRDNGGCSGGVMIEHADGTWVCDVCHRRIY